MKKTRTRLDARAKNAENTNDVFKTLRIDVDRFPETAGKRLHSNAIKTSLNESTDGFIRALFISIKGLHMRVIFRYGVQKGFLLDYTI